MPVNNTEPLSVYRAGPGYAPCLAEMILAASRGHHLKGYIDRLLDLPEEATLAVLAGLAGHPAQVWGKVDKAFVALVDGVCSGMVTARPALDMTGFAFSPEALGEVAEGLGFGRAWAAAVLLRQEDLRRLFRSWEEVYPEGTWLVEYLAVRYENRTAGVAKALMRRVIEEAKTAGASGLTVYCEMGNARAERLYASLGFAVELEYPYPLELAGLGSGIRRLRLGLKA